MVVQLDDAKIKVTFDVQEPGAPGDRRVDERGSRSEVMKKEVKEAVKKEVKKHKSFQLTKGDFFRKQEGRIDKALRLFAGGVAGASLIEKYLPAIVQKTEQLLLENFQEGGALYKPNEFMKKWFGIDLALGIQETVDDIVEPALDKLSEKTKRIDSVFAGIEAFKQTANFARNAALLGRPQGWEKIQEVFDQTQEAKWSHLRQRKFIEREAAEQEMQLFFYGTKNIFRSFGTR